MTLLAWRAENKGNETGAAGFEFYIRDGERESYNHAAEGVSFFHFGSAENQVKSKRLKDGLAAVAKSCSFLLLSRAYLLIRCHSCVEFHEC